MSSGELITRWTIRLALLCYFAALTLLVASRRAQVHRHARALWTLGLALFLIHVAAAFHFFHHWSHAEAYEATRSESRDVAGFDSGVGLWLNYLFLLLWLGETIAWWRDNDRYQRRSPWTAVVIHAFMLFMVVNATLVFETGLSFWLGIAGLAAMLLAAAGRCGRTR